MRKKITYSFLQTGRREMVYLFILQHIKLQNYFVYIILFNYNHSSFNSRPTLIHFVSFRKLINLSWFRFSSHSCYREL